ncbi:MAG: hypothetical protein OQK27_00050, partial [Gammaproteobacteria bacterium]|nr:hypothetical protein [Gammaproteobacteria bacterium]
MSMNGHRLRLWLLASLLLPLSGLSSVQAETADERLQRLETELRELRQMLQEQQQERRETVPAAVAPRSLQPAPVVTAPVAQPGVHIRYYLQNEPLDSASPAAARPLVEGRITETDTLSFDPSAYDVPGAGLMS